MSEPPIQAPTGPLSGLRVVDLTQMVAGPMATMILADQGADVIKVEPPAGDFTRKQGAGPRGLAALFASTNRNKRSIAVDLKDARGVDLVKRLVSGADLFVQNFRPGAIERMGLGEATLRAVRPDLVYVSLSGFGERGPYAAKRVYDPVIQALSGLASIQADPATGRPRMMRLIVPDKVTALTAAQAMTAALLARARTGRGQHLRLAMLDATIAFLWPEGMALQTFPDLDVTPPAPSPDLVFQTADGFLTAGAMSDAEWLGFCRVLGHPEWVDDPRFRTPSARLRNQAARIELAAHVFPERTTADWIARLDAADVPCAPILARADVLEDPQVRENGIVVESAHPEGGRLRQARPAARFSETPASIRRAAPALGEHGQEIALEAGFSEEEIRALEADGVLGAHG
jgi:crotonobetainyl-CoA:carnitine CoA-transferase CaiB-like acyl-CoA transferase